MSPLPLQSDARPVGVGVVNGEGGEFVGGDQQLRDPLVVTEHERVCRDLAEAWAALILLPARLQLLGLDSRERRK